MSNALLIAAVKESVKETDWLLIMASDEVTCSCGATTHGDSLRLLETVVTFLAIPPRQILLHCVLVSLKHLDCDVNTEAER